ncbi:PIN domain-containing protein [Candidatus Saccharibacteria bacterium]|nr:PIN domain-containing protein [Candidatus Saccharibacteria bacterium]
MDSKSREVSIDSCILLRIIQRNNHEQYKKAVDLLLNGYDYYVDSVAIMEVVYVLTKEKMRRAKILENLKTLLDNPMIIYDKMFFAGVFEKYATHPSLSFDDCILEARIAMKRKEPLWTFDKKFANQSEVAELVV